MESVCFESFVKDIYVESVPTTTACLDSDQWQAKCLQFRWQSVSQETSGCTLMGLPRPICVYLQSRADLVQLSQLHLDRQLIQSWRRLTGDCILSNSSTTNSIIFSMLVFVSLPLPLLYLSLPILVLHCSFYPQVYHRYLQLHTQNKNNHPSVYSHHRIIKLFITLRSHWGSNIFFLSWKTYFSPYKKSVAYSDFLQSILNIH